MKTIENVTAYSDTKAGLASALVEIYGMTKNTNIVAVCDEKGEKLIKKYFDPALGIISQMHNCDINLSIAQINESLRPIKELPQKLESLLNSKKPSYTMNIFGYNSEETPFRTSLLKLEEELKAKTVHCPGIDENMFRRWGPFDVDYGVLKYDVENLIKKLYEFESFEIITGNKKEYRLEVNVRGRKWMHDLHVEKGEFGNLPAGEVYIAPIETSANGKLMVEDRAGSFALDTPLVITWKDGMIEKIEGKNKKTADEIMKILESYDNAKIIGEFALGLNKNAKTNAPMLEAEKGGAHTAAGPDMAWGSRIESPYHIDFLNKRSKIYGLRFGERVLVYNEGDIPSIIHF